MGGSAQRATRRWYRGVIATNWIVRLSSAKKRVNIIGYALAQLLASEEDGQQVKMTLDDPSTHESVRVWMTADEADALADHLKDAAQNFRVMTQVRKDNEAAKAQALYGR